MSKRSGVLAATAIGIFVVGCGGGGATTGASTEITKADWIAQADAICTKGDAAVQVQAKKTFGGAKKPSTKDQVAFMTDYAIPSINEEVGQIRSLPMPAGDEQTISQFLDDAEAGAAEAKKDPAGFPKSAPTLDKSSGEAKAYGLKACGKG
jgi:hypothetical protein